MKQHGIIWVIAVGLALALGWMDYETTSLCVLLCNGGNAITLLIFTLVFASIGYGIRSMIRRI
jgi:hypothetical protein